MSVTPAQILEAARALAHGEAEVDQRNAASRAYYAAYHRCLPIARGMGLAARPEHGAHRNLIDTLTNPNARGVSENNKLKSLGYMLDQCRRLRVQADYEIGKNFKKDDTKTALAQCTRILADADGALAKP